MAETTLTDIGNRLQADAGQNRESLDSIKDAIMQSAAISIGPSATSNAINTFVTGMKQDNLANIEKANESTALAEELIDSVETNTKTLAEKIAAIDTSFDFGGFIPNLIAGILATLTSVLAGTLMGAIMGAFKEAKLWSKLINKLTGGIFPKIIKGFGIDGIKLSFNEKMLKISKAMGKIGTTFGSIGETFKGVTASIKLAIAESSIGKAITSVGTFISAQAALLKESFMLMKTSIGGLLKGVAGGGGPAGGGGFFARISKGFGSVTKFIGSFGKLFTSIGTTAGKVAGFVAKIFVPLRAVMVLFDTVMGAWDGFQAEGVLGGIKGAIKGLFKGMIGSILDLVKDGISWIANKFGFGEISESLDSFSFVEEFDKLVDFVFELPASIFDWVSKKVKSIGEDLSAMLGAMMDLDILATLAAGIKGMFKLLYEPILTAVKDIISWVAGLLGFDELSATLDNFSFSDAFDGMIDKIVKVISDFFTGVVNWAKENLNPLKIFDGVGGFISGMLESPNEAAGVAANAPGTPSNVAGETVAADSPRMIRGQQQQPVVLVEGAKGTGDDNSDNSTSTFNSMGAVVTEKNLLGKSIKGKGYSQ